MEKNLIVIAVRLARGAAAIPRDYWHVHVHTPVALDLRIFFYDLPIDSRDLFMRLSIVREKDHPMEKFFLFP